MVFKERPDIGSLRKLIQERQFLNIDSRQPFELKDIDSKSPSGHWNFLVQQEEKTFVLRMVGDEKPVIGDEIEKEYNILKYVALHDVGPKPYYFSKTDFKEPFLLEEFLSGEFLTQLAEEEQKSEFPKIAELIAKINNIPITEEIRPYLREIKSYDQNFQTWRDRLLEIRNDPQYDFLRKEIETIAPESQKRIIQHSQSLKSASESFVFKSAHAGHCVKTNSGLRFLNWEEAGYGDPSYSLAVFLSSIRNRRDFDEVKEVMIKSYLNKLRSINDKEFRDLLDARIFERLVSDTIWPVWMAAIQQRSLSGSEISAVKQRLADIKKALKGY